VFLGSQKTLFTSRKLQRFRPEDGDALSAVTASKAKQSQDITRSPGGFPLSKKRISLGATGILPVEAAAGSLHCAVFPIESYSLLT
jgi:hypothetical protein